MSFAGMHLWSMQNDCLQVTNDTTQNTSVLLRESIGKRSFGREREHDEQVWEEEPGRGRRGRKRKCQRESE